MKSGTINNLKLGLFISIGLACLVAGLFLIGSRHQMFSSTFRVIGLFRNAGGLQAGNNVRLSGVDIGTVDLVSIVSDTLVQVELVIDEDKRPFIRKDAVAAIGTEGLMGNKVVNINPGTPGAPDIEDHNMITAAVPIDVDDILNLMKTSITNTADITGDLSSIIASMRNGDGTIGKLLMDETIANDIDESLDNLKYSATGLREIIERVQGGMSQDLDTTATNLKVAAVELRHLINQANSSWLLWGFGKDKDKEADKAKEAEKVKDAVKEADTVPEPDTQK